ncbi:hypothetical protein DFP72DRAFT_1118012 [Ephemerocybe angulata]|uniref:Uncharacterized protein n=1 Tax=Ephemerocybe angulata TaxID=980116 RepID=A0A8H6H662_9AGAR|nr:hypothetical protein DFP72DRAFT_1118012 [Tulosesus angulatus]
MTTTSTPRLDLPSLSDPLTASSVKAWLERCEDAFEAWSMMNPEKELKPALKILLAGLKMEALEASQWWGENRDTLKALTTFSEFSTKIKERFLPSGWKMDALAVFYAVRQHNLPFTDFVAALQSARGILSAAGLDYKISDPTFKHHLLFFCHPLLSLRVRTLVGNTYDSTKIDSLINLMASTWASMIAEGITSQEPTSLSKSSHTTLSTSERNALRAAGGCFRCRKTPASPGWVAHTSKTCPGDPSQGITPAPTSAVVSAVSHKYDDSDDDVVPIKTIAANLGQLVRSYETSDGEDDSF